MSNKPAKKLRQNRPRRALRKNSGYDAKARGAQSKDAPGMEEFLGPESAAAVARLLIQTSLPKGLTIEEAGVIAATVPLIRDLMATHKLKPKNEESLVAFAAGELAAALERAGKRLRAAAGPIAIESVAFWVELSEGGGGVLQLEERCSKRTYLLGSWKFASPVELQHLLTVGVWDDPEIRTIMGGQSGDGK